MKDRLQKIIIAEGITPAILADEMGVQRSGISHILSGRNNPGYDFLQKLLVRFPKLNAEWLLLGQGSMYKTTAQSTQSNQMQPSLFDQVAEKAPEPYPTKEPIEKLSSVEGDKMVQPEHMSEPKPYQAAKKTIEKIVTFYTDKSFTEYWPE